MNKPKKRTKPTYFSVVLLIFSVIFTSCEVNSKIEKKNLVGLYSLDYNIRPFWFNYAYIEPIEETVNIKEKFYEQIVIFKNRKIINKGTWHLIKPFNSNIFKVKLENAISLEEKRMNDYSVVKSDRFLFVDIRGINFFMQKQSYALC